MVRSDCRHLSIKELVSITFLWGGQETEDSEKHMYRKGPDVPLATGRAREKWTHNRLAMDWIGRVGPPNLKIGGKSRDPQVQTTYLIASAPLQGR
jgi:hypothetical protein